MAKQDDYTRYTIRIPTPLYEQIKAAAGEKSVNAEIIERLQNSATLDGDLVVNAATFDRLVTMLAQRLDEMTRESDASS